MCDAAAGQDPGPAPGSWVTGGSLGRNLYVVAQLTGSGPSVRRQVGMMQTPALAARVVAAVTLAADLAAIDPPANGIGESLCALCGLVLPEHDEGCVYRRAVELAGDG